MNTFTDFPNNKQIMDFDLPQVSIETFSASPIPIRHPAESDTFSRFENIPGHNQEVLMNSRFVLIGAGGLNSWVALGLVRSGARDLVIIDPDFVERTNLTRQYFFSQDLGKPKANSLARNLLSSSVAGCNITAIPFRLEDVLEKYTLPADILITGVDRNDCRLEAAKYARRRHIPAIFTMLSHDGMRCHTFLQGPEDKNPCLWCALPDLQLNSNSPCVSSIISSCYLASAFTTFFVHRAVMGWPQQFEAFNWRESDLSGMIPDKTCMILKRAGCPVCST